MYQIQQSHENGYHIYSGDPKDRLLTRYGILASDQDLPSHGACYREGDSLCFQAKALRRFTIEERSRGYLLSLPLEEDERLFGGGDANRDALMLRGLRLELHIKNVVGYGPMTVLLSTGGWALIVNTTYQSFFDCGKTDPSRLQIEVTNGEVDFYLIRGRSLPELLSGVTAITGRAALMPKFAYGLTMVQNEESNSRSLLWDVRTLRDKGIPCDTMGLEPNWMETYYDYSTDKKWNKKAFPLPFWQSQNYSGTFSLFYPLRKMGMQLSLWLCENYDVFYHEENSFLSEEEISLRGAEIPDANLCKPSRLDKITKMGEPWFEHLKKFVDNGAAAFKLDGATQVIPHPDRLWGGKYTDDQAHNIYPVLLAKQMQEGFKDYTGRRLLLYSAGAFTGSQQYAATWAGDTGGGAKTAVSLMNYAMCGHSNTSCDIQVSPQGLHYGFLIPWSQYFCWANWMYPWFMGEELEECTRFYSRLRSSLIPYLYTYAHTAYESGIPLLRPLPLMYEEDARLDQVLNAYLLGDSLYVGVFDLSLTLPRGRWVDYFTGAVYEDHVDYCPPKGIGGALFVKEGSIIATMTPQNYVLEKPHDYVIRLYPGADCDFTLYEDDGFTYQYQQGAYALTKFSISDSCAEGFSFTIHPRQGSYEGAPDNGHDVENNSIPNIPGMAEERDCTILIAHRSLASVTLEGEELPLRTEEGHTLFTAPLQGRGDKPLCFQVRYL